MKGPPPLAWLFSLEKFGMKLGLAAVRALIVALDRPGLDVPTILVTGTNGKGSTAAMAASILAAAGTRTLLYTSPHVATVRERIQVDGRMISTAALARHLVTIRRCIETLRRRGGLPHHPTYFEVLTAAALLHGRARRVGAQVLEIGLGGRYDATNVVPARVAVITNIALDHAEQLGRTLRRVAWNKAGIIKGGEIVLTAEAKRVPMSVIRRQARAKGAVLLRVGVRPEAARRRNGPRLAPAPRLAPTLRLAGSFQTGNAALAATAASVLWVSIHARRLPARAVRSGLARAWLPGRFELRRASRQRVVVLDGAHNPAAAACLAAEMRRSLPGRPVTLLFGVMLDKDAAGIAHHLFPIASRLVLCRPRTRRAASPVALRRLVPVGHTSVVVADPVDAFRCALGETPPGGVLLATGSFYLLGDLAAAVARLPRLPSAMLRHHPLR